MEAVSGPQAQNSSSISAARGRPTGERGGRGVKASAASTCCQPCTTGRLRRRGRPPLLIPTLSAIIRALDRRIYPNSYGYWSTPCAAIRLLTGIGRTAPNWHARPPLSATTAAGRSGAMMVALLPIGGATPLVPLTPLEIASSLQRKGARRLFAPRTGCDRGHGARWLPPAVPRHP